MKRAFGKTITSIMHVEIGFNRQILTDVGVKVSLVKALDQGLQRRLGAVQLLSIESIKLKIIVNSYSEESAVCVMADQGMRAKVKLCS